ncbi:MAG: hypothetical protein AB4058_08435 [Microcystaceae cyanobacterium]
MTNFHYRNLGFSFALSLLLSATLGIFPSYASDHHKPDKKDSTHQNTPYHLQKTHSLLESPNYPVKPNEWMQETAGERSTHGGQVILVKW